MPVLQASASQPATTLDRTCLPPYRPPFTFDPFVFWPTGRQPAQAALLTGAGANVTAGWDRLKRRGIARAFSRLRPRTRVGRGSEGDRARSGSKSAPLAGPFRETRPWAAFSAGSPREQSITEEANGCVVSRHGRGLASKGSVRQVRPRCPSTPGVDHQGEALDWGVSVFTGGQVRRRLDQAEGSGNKGTTPPRFSPRRTAAGVRAILARPGYRPGPCWESR
jgi:hypothetical protein